MGTWDAGNFDDDSALDWLGTEVYDRLVGAIEDGLGEHDEGNGAEIMAAVEILALICENTPMIPPRAEDVARWRKAYLETWHGYIDGLDPAPGFKEARRQAIEATFDRLAATAKKKAVH